MSKARLRHFAAGRTILSENPFSFRNCASRSATALKLKLSGANSSKSATNEPAEFSFEQIIGESKPMRKAIEMAKKVAASDISSILLQGETGTGKDLFARAIHYASDRRNAPYLAINCAALPANLIESELFGHEKGAFTDAKAKKEGLFEQAHGGTIFLDEIGEMEIALQAKLLRVLEDGRFRRVGGLKDIPIDARIVAASNRDLKKESGEGNFRLDLLLPSFGHTDKYSAAQKTRR